MIHWIVPRLREETGGFWVCVHVVHIWTNLLWDWCGLWYCPAESDGCSLLQEKNWVSSCICQREEVRGGFPSCLCQSSRSHIRPKRWAHEKSAVWPNCRIPKSATEICTWPSLITSWSRFLNVFQIWKVFDDMRQAFPEEAFQSVLKSYGHHFDSGRLRSELQVLYSDQDLQSNRGKLCDYLVFLKDMELDSAMPQLYKLFSLVATIGATSAGVERSFSCLKRLKSYTRNTMGQGRLSSLALLAIERTLVKSLEKMPSWYDRVTEHFLEKERRAEFTYK